MSFLFAEANTGERAVLVVITDEKDELEELRRLAIAAAAEPVGDVAAKVRRPNARFFISSGKLEELGDTVRSTGADIVLFNHALSPGQERNLERFLGVRVVDRNGLILDIFAQRARSFEGKLQVELAQLDHLSARLVHGWQHLERQKGGIGLRGPGEAQLETDRRLVDRRIEQIRKRLHKVEQQRQLGRQARAKAEVPTVALVGYTNAGKSTLFNALTAAHTYVADQLFATLDPTLRHIPLANGMHSLLIDTVGFIRDLPHELIAAFKSTLQEVCHADLLLHVIDAGATDYPATIHQVNQVLADIGANHIKQIEVYNKIDLLEQTDAKIERDETGQISRIWVSAHNDLGLAAITASIDEFFSEKRVRRQVFIAFSEAGLRARLFRVAKVLRDEIQEQDGWEMEVEIEKKDLSWLQRHARQPENHAVVNSPFAGH